MRRRRDPPSSLLAIVAGQAAMVFGERRHTSIPFLATTDLAQRVVALCKRKPTRSIELSQLAEQLQWRDMEKGNLYPKSLKKYIAALHGIVELIEEEAADRATRSAVVVVSRRGATVGALREDDLLSAVEIIAALRLLGEEGDIDGALSVTASNIAKDVLIQVSVALPSELSVSVPTVGRGGEVDAGATATAVVRLGPRQRAQATFLSTYPAAAGSGVGGTDAPSLDSWRHAFVVDYVVPLVQLLMVWMHSVAIETLERLLAWPRVASACDTPPSTHGQPLLGAWSLRDLLTMEGVVVPGTQVSTDGRRLEFSTMPANAPMGPIPRCSCMAPFLATIAAGVAQGPTEALHLLHLLVRLLFGELIPLLETRGGGAWHIHALAERLRWVHYKYHFGPLCDFVAHFDGVFCQGMPAAASSDGDPVTLGATPMMVTAANPANVTFPLLFARLMMPFMMDGIDGAVPLPAWYEALCWSRCFQPKFGVLQNCLVSVGCRVEPSGSAGDGTLLMVSMRSGRELEDWYAARSRSSRVCPPAAAAGAAMDAAIRRGKRKQLCRLLASIDPPMLSASS